MVALERFSTDAGSLVGRARLGAQLKVLREFASAVAPLSLLDADGRALEQFLAERGAAGRHPNTLRKERGMVLSFFAWAYESGFASAETLLSIRATPVPAESRATVKPSPYTRRELDRLRDTLDSRWPLLDDREAVKRIARWVNGTGRYARLRRHAIRLQLEAVIALALHCGLRRCEIGAVTVDDVHPDNAYVVARKPDGSLREAPMPEVARAAIARWFRVRDHLGAEHDRPWLALWAESTCRRPMSEDALDRLLTTYVGPEWSLRRLRHTCAIAWLRAGMQLWDVQRLLGHRSIRHTLPYAEAVRSDPLRAAQRVEPHAGGGGTLVPISA